MVGGSKRHPHGVYKGEAEGQNGREGRWLVVGNGDEGGGSGN